MRELSNKIINRLPYDESFIFIKEIIEINNDSITSKYWFNKDDAFYKSHFKHIPVTPGVFIIEMMGQAGPISHLIYLEKLYQNKLKFHPVVTDIKASFLKEIKPEEVLVIKSIKKYFRNNIIRSTISVYDDSKNICSISELQIKIFFDK